MVADLLLVGHTGDREIIAVILRAQTPVGEHNGFKPSTLAGRALACGKEALRSAYAHRPK
jgi:hypothetical protein